MSARRALCAVHETSCVRYTGNEGIGILGHNNTYHLPGKPSPDDDLLYAQDHDLGEWTSCFLQC